MWSTATRPAVGDGDLVLGDDELGLPDPGERRALVDEVHHRRRRRRGSPGWSSSPGPTRWLEDLGAERGGALDGGGGVLDAEADVADADAVGQVGGMGEALGARC